MKEKLRQFNGDRGQRSDLLEYVVAYFEKKILKAAYDGGDVRALAAAVTELKNAFDQLDIDYAITTKEPKPVNEAR